MYFSSLILCFICHFTSVEALSKFLTINVPVVYMGRYEVVLRGLKIETFWAQMAIFNKKTCHPYAQHLSLPSSFFY